MSKHSCSEHFSLAVSKLINFELRYVKLFFDPLEYSEEKLKT